MNDPNRYRSGSPDLTVLDWTNLFWISTFWTSGRTGDPMYSEVHPSDIVVTHEGHSFWLTIGVLSRPTKWKNTIEGYTVFCKDSLSWLLCLPAVPNSDLFDQHHSMHSK